VRFFSGVELVWWQFLLLAAGCTIVAGVTAALLAPHAARLRLGSRRRRDRFSRRSVPLTGGAGLLAGGVAALWVLHAAPTPGEWVAVGGLFLVGLLDDVAELPVTAKLLLQVGVSFCAVVLLVPSAGLVGLALLVFLLLVNACNYLDNMDGLLAGVALPSAVSLALFGSTAGLGATVLMVALPGILILSRPPARIFLGDSGSHLVGALFAMDATRMLLADGRFQAGVLVPLCVLFAVPLADVATVTVSRLRRGRPIFRGGTDHLSHRLVRLGWSVPSAVVLLVLASAVCGIASLLLVHS
jgi:UDP-GlcNAc:undecaprenyl-phosphate GlcNAc-1-phosphate transferase